MIGYLRGKIIDHTEGRLIVDCGGVGYSVAIPLSGDYVACSVGRGIELFVYTHVREDALDLYGFLTRAEKELYLTLLGVSGIGPKGAMSFLSGAEPAQILEAIVSGDKTFLTTIPGVGKKTAERVVLELSDSIKKKIDRDGLSIGRSKTGRAMGNVTVIQDAKTALVGLGYREQDALGLLNRIVAEEGAPIVVEDLIRMALKSLRER